MHRDYKQSTTGCTGDPEKNCKAGLTGIYCTRCDDESAASGAPWKSSCSSERVAFPWTAHTLSAALHNWRSLWW